MARIFMAIFVVLAVSAPTAAASASVEGLWANPKRNVVVKLASCGNAYCGTVVEASERAKAKARQGGTPHLVGTRILNNLRPTNGGAYKGHAFDPKRNIRAPATLRLIGPNAIEVRGCLVSGILCKEQRWTRVG